MRKRDALKKALSDSWQRADVIPLPVTGDDIARGMCRLAISFTMNGDVLVTVGPDLGAHLVQWALGRAANGGRQGGGMSVRPWVVSVDDFSPKATGRESRHRPAST